MLGTLLQLLLGFVFLVVVAIAAAVVICAYTTLPLTDALNRLLRAIGLAGPSSETRAAGMRTHGVVDGAFTLREGRETAEGRVFAGGEIWNATCAASLAGTLEPGDRVDVVYNEDLTVTILGRSSQE